MQDFDYTVYLTGQLCLDEGRHLSRPSHEDWSGARGGLGAITHSSEHTSPHWEVRNSLFGGYHTQG